MTVSLSKTGACFARLSPTLSFRKNDTSEVALSLFSCPFKRVSGATVLMRFAPPLASREILP